MKVEINKPKEVVVVQEQKKSFKTLTVSRIIDLPQLKKVIVYISEISEPITMWEGQSYDSIGNWTKDMISARLNEIYGSIR